MNQLRNHNISSGVLPPWEPKRTTSGGSVTAAVSCVCGSFLATHIDRYWSRPSACCCKLIYFAFFFLLTFSLLYLKFIESKAKVQIECSPESDKLMFYLTVNNYSLVLSTPLFSVAMESTQFSSLQYCNFVTPFKVSFDIVLILRLFFKELLMLISWCWPSINWMGIMVGFVQLRMEAI